MGQNSGQDPGPNQKEIFAARMARIQKGGLHTNRTLFIGIDESLEIPKGGVDKIVSKRAALSPWMKGRDKTRTSMLGPMIALMVGAVAFPVALLGTLNPGGGMVMSSTSLPGGPLGAGLALGLITAFVIGLRTPVTLAATALGAIGMAAGFHNLVHAAPDLVAQVFPSDWVTSTLATTRMGTLLPLADILSL